MSTFRKYVFHTLLVCAMTFSFINASFAQTLESVMSDYREGDVDRARRAWKDLAEDGNADALFNLGQIYRYGYGVEANLDDAALYLTQASRMGHTPAQRELANLYFFDIGTKDMKRTAINLWQTAAQNGDGRAQYTLGVLFFTGDMVVRNQALGFAWTLLATEVGVSEATQLQTAMQAQLSEKDLQRGLELSGTLMTGAGYDSNYAVLVGEMPLIPRKTQPPVQIAEVQAEENPVEIMPEPASEETTGGTIAEVVMEEPKAEDIVVAENNDQPQPEDQPASEEMPIAQEMEVLPPAEQPVKEMPEEEAAVFVEVEPDEQDPPTTAAADDEFDETRQVLAELIVETSQSEVIAEITNPAETTIFVEETLTQTAVVPYVQDQQDLGDPNSPLVNAEGFGDDWSLQLTSFRKPENTEAYWQDMLKDYSDLFMGIEKKILRFDLGPDKGIYYRLRVGPFASKEIADQKCLELKENELGCLVIWP